MKITVCQGKGSTGNASCLVGNLTRTAHWILGSLLSLVMLTGCGGGDNTVSYTPANSQMSGSIPGNVKALLAPNCSNLIVDVIIDGDTNQPLPLTALACDESGNFTGTLDSGRAIGTHSFGLVYYINDPRYSTPVEVATYPSVAATIVAGGSASITFTEPNTEIDSSGDNISNIVKLNLGLNPFVKNTFKVAVSVTGLTGTGLVLANNGTDMLPISGTGSFNFSTPLLYTATYNVTIGAQPKGFTCGVASGSGTMGTSDVSVNVICVSNTFTPLTATMKTARAGHTATLLPNGQMLLAGGGGGDAPVLNTAELYDPVANTFTSLTATMTTARRGHAATLLPNGQVLIVGGLDGSGISLNSAELYDPVADTFTPLRATMATDRYWHKATLLPNGQVLIAGGLAGSGISLNSVELYDPVANTFKPLTATMTTAHYFHTATLLPNGQVLIAGGVSAANSFGILLNSAELYDPVANTFKPLTATMTTARYGHTATLLPNGQVLIAGGYGDGVLNTAELYDPVANTFTPLTATMTSARYAHAATLLPNGQVLLTGGAGGSQTVILNTAEVFGSLL